MVILSQNAEKSIELRKMLDLTVISRRKKVMLLPISSLVEIRIVDGERFVDGSAFSHELDRATRVRRDITNSDQSMGQCWCSGCIVLKTRIII